MGDTHKTKKQLLDELDLLRGRIAAMESQGSVAVNREEKEHYFIQDVRLLSSAAMALCSSAAAGRGFRDRGEFISQGITLPSGGGHGRHCGTSQNHPEDTGKSSGRDSHSYQRRGHERTHQRWTDRGSRRPDVHFNGGDTGTHLSGH